MKLLLEATVAGKSDVLAAGMVRVNVTGAESGKVLGRVTLTVDLWEWIRSWITAANDLGVPGIEIQVVEVEYRAEDRARPTTMRGRLLEAVETASERLQDDLGDTEGRPGGSGLQGGGTGSRVSGLWKRVQNEKAKGERK